MLVFCSRVRKICVHTTCLVSIDTQELDVSDWLQRLLGAGLEPARDCSQGILSPDRHHFTTWQILPLRDKVYHRTMSEYRDLLGETLANHAVYWTTCGPKKQLENHINIFYIAIWQYFVILLWFSGWFERDVQVFCAKRLECGDLSPL